MTDTASPQSQAPQPTPEGVRALRAKIVAITHKVKNGPRTVPEALKHECIALLNDPVWNTFGPCISGSWNDSISTEYNHFATAVYHFGELFKENKYPRLATACRDEIAQKDLEILHFVDSEIYLNQSDYDLETFKKLQEMVKRYPTNIEIQYNMGGWYKKHENVEAAAKHFKRAKELGAYNIEGAIYEVYAEEFNRRMEKNDIEGVEEIMKNLEEFASTFPRDTQSYIPKWVDQHNDRVVDLKARLGQYEKIEAKIETWKAEGVELTNRTVATTLAIFTGIFGLAILSFDIEKSAASPEAIVSGISSITIALGGLILLTYVIYSRQSKWLKIVFTLFFFAFLAALPYQTQIVSHIQKALTQSSEAIVKMPEPILSQEKSVE